MNGNSYIVVKEGDTLSELVQKHSSSPPFLYGKNGRIEKVLGMNPSIIDADFIEVDQLIEFGNLMIAKDPTTGNILSQKLYQSPKNQIRKIAQAATKEKVHNYSQSKKNIQSLYFSLLSGLSSISSRDLTSQKQENATSDVGYGTLVAWSHLWTKKTSFFFAGSFKKFTFKVDKTKTLKDNSISQYYTGIGLKHTFWKRHALSFSVGIGESLALVSVSNGVNFAIEKVVLPVLSISGAHNLIKFDSGFTFDTSWRYGALLPSKQLSYSTELGTFFNIGLASNYNLNGVHLAIGASYTKRSLKIETATQTSKDLMTNIGAGWSF